MLFFELFALTDKIWVAPKTGRGFFYDLAVMSTLPVFTRVRFASKKRSRAVAGHEVRPPADRAVAGGASSPPLGGARAARQDCQDILPLSLVSVFGRWQFRHE